MFIQSDIQLPCFAVIFSSVKGLEDDSYEEMAETMNRLVQLQPGFLGMESVLDDEGHGITVCYWRSLEDIKRWKEVEIHKLAQSQGKREWYKEYAVRVVEVKESYWHSL